MYEVRALALECMCVCDTYVLYYNRFVIFFTPFLFFVFFLLAGAHSLAAVCNLHSRKAHRVWIVVMLLIEANDRNDDGDDDDDDVDDRHPVIRWKWKIISTKRTEWRIIWIFVCACVLPWPIFDDVQHCGGVRGCGITFWVESEKYWHPTPYFIWGPYFVRTFTGRTIFYYQKPNTKYVGKWGVVWGCSLSACLDLGVF